MAMLTSKDKNKMSNNSTSALMKQATAHNYLMAQHCTVVERIKPLEDNVKRVSILNFSLTQKNREAEVTLNVAKEKLAVIEEERDKLRSESKSLKRYLKEKTVTTEANAKALQEKTAESLKLSKNLKKAMALAGLIKADCSDKGYCRGWSECKKKYAVESPPTASPNVSLSSDAVLIFQMLKARRRLQVRIKGKP